MTVPLILDTDIGSDVDDALALAFAIRHPGIDLRAVTTVSGDTGKRAQIAAKLLRIAGRDDVEVAAGVASTFPPGSRANWGGHEGVGLLEDGKELPVSQRDAVTLLLEECASRPAAEGGCEIATVGMQSNVAAAIARDAAFAGRVRRLTVMGGVFSSGPPGGEMTAADDHNLNVDPDAAVRSLNAGIPTLYVPGDVTVETFLTADQLERLRAADRLCQALARLVDVWAPLLRQTSGSRLRADQVAVLHDPLAVATTVDTRFVTVQQKPVRAVLQDGLVRTEVDPARGHPADVVTSVDAEAFTEFFLETVAGRS